MERPVIATRAEARKRLNIQSFFRVFPLRQLPSASPFVDPLPSATVSPHLLPSATCYLPLSPTAHLVPPTTPRFPASLIYLHPPPSPTQPFIHSSAMMNQGERETFNFLIHVVETMDPDCDCARCERGREFMDYLAALKVRDQLVMQLEDIVGKVARLPMRGLTKILRGKYVDPWTTHAGVLATERASARAGAQAGERERERADLRHCSRCDPPTRVYISPSCLIKRRVEFLKR